MPSAFAKTTALVLLVLTVDVFRVVDGGHNDQNDEPKWIRLCTLTSAGGSRLNMSMPCGVRVEGESDAAGGNRGDAEGAENYVRVDVNPVRGGGKTQDDGGGTQDDDGETQEEDGKMQGDGGNMKDDGGKTPQDGGGTTQDNDGETQNDEFKGLEITAANDRMVDIANPVGQEQNVDVRLEAIASGGTENQEEVEHNYDGEYKEDDITVEVDDYGVGDGGDSEREEKLGPKPLKTVVFSYLEDARDQLYNKIHYLLSVLQNAFFNGKLNHRRSRRDSIDRRLVALKSNGRQAAMNIKPQTIASAILKPTFERSIMTMSFLMFGVFVIQVVQRLMQTLQQSSEMMSMGLGNSVHGNLPTASASIF